MTDSYPAIRIPNQPKTATGTNGRVITVKSPGFLVPQPVLRKVFREAFRRELNALLTQHPEPLLPVIDAAVWKKDWGVHLQSFGNGKHAIQYLGAYVCRTAIGDARILAVNDTDVTFAWRDRAKNNARRIETITGIEFVRRYLRHVLPIGMRAIRRYGFCCPAAKATRERIAFHTGCILFLGPPQPPPAKPGRPCPCCGAEMLPVLRLPATWRSGRAPPLSQCA